MAVPGGRERARSEVAALLATAGLRLERVISTPIRDRIVEAAPV
jgi:hypothetical protein